MQAGEQDAGWSSLSSWVLLVFPALAMTLKFGITLKMPSSLHRHRKMPPALLCSQCPHRHWAEQQTAPRLVPSERR